MIDFARITITAGRGGNGSGSFHKVKGKRYGKADGGNGGDGGNVYFQATSDLNTLEKYRYVKDYKAEDGSVGSSNHRKGATGTELILIVPIGTHIKVESTPTQFDSDLIENDQKILVARGGQGGRGNAHLRDDFGRRPKYGEKGQAGEVSKITLELKLIADVGLIGLPNAGKSTLLAKLTAAKPKIAPYPFTTLEPNLGVFNSSKRKLVIADIPGLIEGASRGRGLGGLFLRHIERTKILVHLIEPAPPDQLWQIYQTIRQELKAYSKELTKKKEIIVITKIDLLDKSTLEETLNVFKSHRKRAFPISAQTDEGLQKLTAAISENLATSQVSQGD